MGRIPTEAEIDAMSEEELQAYLASAEDASAAWGRAGAGAARASGAGEIAGGRVWTAPLGASGRYPWLLVVASLLGLTAAWELMVAELTIIREPLAQLTCDLNPFVSCGASLDTWQGNLLGVPNSFVGAMAFSVLLCLGLALASGARLPRWMWCAMCVACLGAVVFVGWFLTESVTVFGKLCPWCMVIWAVTVPVAAATWGEAGGNGALGRGGVATALWRWRWWVAGALYLVIAVTVLVAFWDGWVSLLR